MAEEPLFGFEGASRRDKLLENVVSGVVIVFVGLTILFCLINSGKVGVIFDELGCHESAFSDGQD